MGLIWTPNWGSESLLFIHYITIFFSNRLGHCSIAAHEIYDLKSRSGPTINFVYCSEQIKHGPSGHLHERHRFTFQNCVHNFNVLYHTAKTVGEQRYLRNANIVHACSFRTIGCLIHMLPMDQLASVLIWHPVVYTICARGCTCVMCLFLLS